MQYRAGQTPEEYRQELLEELDGRVTALDIFWTDYQSKRVLEIRKRLKIVSVPLEAEEIAVGDYSPEYGTVTAVEPEGESVALTFKNGKRVVVNKDTQLEIDQGGRFVHSEQ